MPIWQSVCFQNSSSPSMESLYFFHDHCMSILIMILLITGGMLMSNSPISGSEEMEIFWSSLPAIILISIALPSLKTLYLLEESSSPNMTLKVMGNQWYWSYQLSNSLKFESFLDEGDFRLLSTSNSLIIPFNEIIRLNISSSDVIHSWTIPSMGVKVDAVPGRMNQIFFLSKRIGLFFGQCSEVCGEKHSFMPISISSVYLA